MTVIYEDLNKVFGYMDKFDLEQQMMHCWTIVEDLDMLYSYVMETPEIDRDRLANMLLGLKDLNQLRFQRMQVIFEEVTNQGGSYGIQEKRSTGQVHFEEDEILGRTDSVFVSDNH